MKTGVILFLSLLLTAASARADLTINPIFVGTTSTIYSPAADTVGFDAEPHFGGVSADITATFEVLSNSLAAGTPVDIAISLLLQGTATITDFFTGPSNGAVSAQVDWSGTTLGDSLTNFIGPGSEQVSYSQASSEVIVVPVGELFSFDASLTANAGIAPGRGGASIGGTLIFGAGGFTPDVFVVDPSTGIPAPDPTITPEPASWLLFGLGLLVILYGRRKRDPAPGL